MQRRVTETHFLKLHDDLSGETKKTNVYVIENGVSRVVGNVLDVSVDLAIKSVSVHLEVDADTERRLRSGELKGLPLNSYVLTVNDEPKATQ